MIKRTIRFEYLPQWPACGMGPPRPPVPEQTCDGAWPVVYSCVQPRALAVPATYTDTEASLI